MKSCLTTLCLLACIRAAACCIFAPAVRGTGSAGEQPGARAAARKSFFDDIPKGTLISDVAYLFFLFNFKNIIMSKSNTYHPSGKLPVPVLVVDLSELIRWVDVAVTAHKDSTALPSPDCNTARALCGTAIYKCQCILNDYRKAVS